MQRPCNEAPKEIFTCACATHRNTLQRTATRMMTLQREAADCSALQCVALSLCESLCLSCCSLSRCSLFRCSLSLSLCLSVSLSLLLYRSQSLHLFHLSLLLVRAQVFCRPQVLTIVIRGMFIVKRCYPPVASLQYIQCEHMSEYSCMRTTCVNICVYKCIHLYLCVYLLLEIHIHVIKIRRYE